MFQVNNACATGSTALFMAKQFVEGGLAECTMALGFEKMERGSLSAHVSLIEKLVNNAAIWSWSQVWPLHQYLAYDKISSAVLWCKL